VFASCVASVGCGSSTPEAQTPKAAGVDPHSVFAAPSDPRCDSTIQGREFSEYDTSGDDLPDVRKVFMRVGEVATSRLVLICRQADVNHDAKRDVVRLYDDEGRPTREETDRNFDGKVDEITHYQSGEVVVHELDNNFDGRIDTKVFYDKGKPARAERDLAGRSTDTQWHPDRWEYFEAGKLVRMGTDFDGDTRVDHWDRDLTYKHAQEAAKIEAANTDGDNPQ
jgi:hypothetical protein